MVEKEPGRQLAESVAHFLWWTGWLDNQDAHQVVLTTRGSISKIEGSSLTTREEIQMGTESFNLLQQSLDDSYPDWRSWNPNYGE